MLQFIGYKQDIEMPLSILLPAASRETFAYAVEKIVDVKSVHELPLPRSNFAAGFDQSTGDLIILGGLGGGTTNATKYPSTRIHYNTRTKEPGTLVQHGSTFTWCNGTELDDQLYYMDGHNGNYVNNVYRLDISGGSPVSRAGSPEPRRHSSLVIEADGKIYRLGGFTYTGALTKKAHVYDPATNTWSTIADMPFSSNGITGCSYNGKIYVFHGWSTDTNPAAVIRGVQIYDIATNTWSFVETEEFGTWKQGAGHGRYFFSVTKVPVDGMLRILRYDLENLRKKPKVTKFAHAGQRCAGSVKIDEVTRELHLIGGCDGDPGMANYENLPRYNNILSFDLDLLLV